MLVYAEELFCFSKCGSLSVRPPFCCATALLGNYCFSSFNSRFSISTGMVQEAFGSPTVRKKNIWTSWTKRKNRLITRKTWPMSKSLALLW